MLRGTSTKGVATLSKYVAVSHSKKEGSLIPTETRRERKLRASQTPRKRGKWREAAVRQIPHPVTRDIHSIVRVWTFGTSYKAK